MLDFMQNPASAIEPNFFLRIICGMEGDISDKKFITESIYLPYST